jgi:hypothetical protein
MAPHTGVEIALQGISVGEKRQNQPILAANGAPVLQQEGKQQRKEDHSGKTPKSELTRFNSRG